MSINQLFQDLTIVELASVLAGPSVGQFFAELGAKVIKIENKKTGGDVTRKWRLPNEKKDTSFSAYYQSTNWGKESLFYDLSDKKDNQIVRQLISQSTIVIANFKKGSAEKLNMDYPSLKRINPALIYANLTAYGDDIDAPGFDVLMQAETGFLFMNGEANRPPVKMPVALIDLLAAHQIKEALLIALIKKTATGSGSYVAVSLVKSAIASLANQASNWLNAAHIPQRMGTQHPNISPYGDIFKTNDGKEIIVAIGTDKQFSELCSILGLEELYKDDRFTTNAARVQNRADLIEQLQKGFMQNNQAELLKQFQLKKVPAGVIRNMKEVFEMPVSQEMILHYPNGSKGLRSIAFDLK